MVALGFQRTHRLGGGTPRQGSGRRGQKLEGGRRGPKPRRRGGHGSLSVLKAWAGWSLCWKQFVVDSPALLQTLHLENKAGDVHEWRASVAGAGTAGWVGVGGGAGTARASHSKGTAGLPRQLRWVSTELGRRVVDAGSSSCVVSVNWSRQPGVQGRARGEVASENQCRSSTLLTAQ